MGKNLLKLFILPVITALFYINYSLALEPVKSDITVKNIIEGMLKAKGEIKDFSAVYTVSSAGQKQPENNIQVSYKVISKQPDKVYLSYDMSSSGVKYSIDMYLNGKEYWSYNSDKKIASKSILNNAACDIYPDIHGYILRAIAIMENPDSQVVLSGQDKISGKNMYVIEARQTDKNEKWKFWIGEEDYFPYRQELWVNDTLDHIERYEHIRINIGINDRLFTFIPPKNSIIRGGHADIPRWMVSYKEQMKK